MTFNPNGLVEFYAKAPTASTITTASWHIDNATPGTQVRLFYGHISDVEVSPSEGLTVTCKDPFYKANGVKIQRDSQNGITIPKIAFNLPRDNPDFWYSIKLVSPASPLLGVGETTEADSRATLRQILEYLEHEFKAQLVIEGVLESAALTLFVSTDLAGLDMKPGPVILENTGFADGVKQILRDWAPHLRLVIDHQTTQWRLVQYGPQLKDKYATGTSTCIAVGGFPYLSHGQVDDVTFFSATPGADGNRVRIFSTINPSLSEERTIYSISGPTLNFNETGVRDYAFAAWTCYPVHPDTLPTLDISIDDVVPSNARVAIGFDNVYTAVNLYSVYQTTESRTEQWNRQDLGTGALQPGWDSGFESAWNDKDSDRESDFGVDGQGMKPYTTGNDGTNDYFMVPFSQSQHSTDHVDQEWVDCSVWMWKVGGADVKNQNRTYRIKSTARVSDVGNGTPGLRITISHPVGIILSDNPTLSLVATGGSDRIILTQNYRFTTTGGNNKRWEVGRKFYFTETTIQYQYDQDASPHVTMCSSPKISQDNGTGTNRRYAAMNQNLGYPQTNTGPTGAWETLATGGLGAFHVWRRATYSRAPVGSPCASGSGWQPPRLLQVEYETTTRTLRSARFPTTGYGGTAFARYGFNAQLDIAVEHWAEDTQTPDYESLAYRLWQIYSHAHHQGEIRKPGLVENGVWLDLGVTCQLRSTLSASSYGSSYEGFWGTLTRAEYDFANDEMVFSFDSKSRIQGFTTKVYEEYGLKTEKSIVPELMALIRKGQELSQCLAGSQLGEQPQGLCAERVYDKTNQTILKKITVLSSKSQQESGASQGGASW